jgi:hypothetical protein
MTGHPRARPRVRYHITVTEHTDGQPTTTVMDASGAAFHAIVGDIRTPGRLQADYGKAGPPHLLEHLADLITNNKIHTR